MTAVIIVIRDDCSELCPLSDMPGDWFIAELKTHTDGSWRYMVMGVIPVESDEANEVPPANDEIGGDAVRAKTRTNC